MDSFFPLQNRTGLHIHGYRVTLIGRGLASHSIELVDTRLQNSPQQNEENIFETSCRQYSISASYCLSGRI